MPTGRAGVSLAHELAQSLAGARITDSPSQLKELAGVARSELGRARSSGSSTFAGAVSVSDAVTATGSLAHVTTPEGQRYAQRSHAFP
jgi:hypothetical protein